MEKLDMSGKGAFRLVGEAIFHCFVRIAPPRNALREKIVKKNRCKFAKSRIVSAWCDVANLDFKRVSDKIIECNKNK